MGGAGGGGLSSSSLSPSFLCSFVSFLCLPIYLLVGLCSRSVLLIMIVTILSAPNLEYNALGA